MVKGNWWYIFAVMLLTTLLYYVFAAVLALFVALFFRGELFIVLSGVVGNCVSVFVSALSCVMFANLFLISKDRLVNVGK